MARSHSSEQPSADTADTIDLARALSRLEAKILTSDPHSRLRYSPYERTKTTANLTYAHSLLLRLEHSTSAIRTQSLKHSRQSTLLSQRQLLKCLHDRLYELSQHDDGTSYASDASTQEEDEGEEDADIRAALAEPTLQTPASATAPSPVSAAQPQARSLQDPDSARGDITTLKDTPAFQPTSTLRSRRAQAPATDTSTTTAHALHPSSAAPSGKPSIYLFNPTSSTSPTFPSQAASPSPSTTTPPSAAHLLSAQTSTQDSLTTSLLDLATQLKTSAQDFSADLAADEETLAKTQDALGKNVDGMDAASRRMGTLRRMSEGRWWWGRMVLYAIIAGLWVVALLLVFVGPKIRF